MKSAYELAMNRLEKEKPLPKMTGEKKEALAEIDSQFEAKIAERRVFLEGEIAKASNDPSACEQLRSQLHSEIVRLEEQREEKKERVRSEK